MTIDYIIALAGAIVGEHSQRGGDDTPHVALARAILALLTPDKPCGWDAEFVARVTAPNVEGYCFFEVEHLEAAWPHEAHWAAVEILRAASQARKEQG